MRFFRTIRDILGLENPDLADKLGTGRQNVYNWCEGKTPKQEEFVRILQRLRKLSKLSWKQFGALIDAEYDDKEPKQ